MSDVLTVPGVVASAQGKPLTAEQSANQARAGVFAVPVNARAKGVLFPVEPKTGSTMANGSEGGNAAESPNMSGNIEFVVGGVKTTVSLSGFIKVGMESGNPYLSLSLGVEGGVHYYGKLFNKMEKKAETALSDPAKAEKMRDYSGYITVLPCWPKGHPQHTNYGEDDWEGAPQLSIFGSNDRADGTGMEYIRLDLVPQRDERPVAANAFGF